MRYYLHKHLLLCIVIACLGACEKSWFAPVWCTSITSAWKIHLVSCEDLNLFCRSEWVSRFHCIFSLSLVFLLRLKNLASFLGLVVTSVILTFASGKGQRPSSMFYCGFGGWVFLQYLQGRHFLLLCLNLSICSQIPVKSIFLDSEVGLKKCLALPAEAVSRGVMVQPAWETERDCPFPLALLFQTSTALNKTSQIYFHSEFIHSYEKLPNRWDTIAP